MQPTLDKKSLEIIMKAEASEDLFDKRGVDCSLPMHSTDSKDTAGQSFIVSFEGPEDQGNPMNWPKRKKWGIVALLSSMQTMVNLGTLMCTPAVPLILSDFSQRNNDIYSVLLVSIWELGEAFGPLLVAPLSEYFGRYPIYQTANTLFIVFCLASGFSSNAQMLIIFRLFNGLSVASVTLDSTVVGDMFVTEERGSVMSILGLAPLIGPVLGPTLGGLIASSIGWRWMFWILACVTGGIQISFAIIFKETYKVTLLERKAKHLRLETGNPAFRSEIQRPHGLKPFLQQGLIRPAKMTCRSPALLMVAVYVSIIFAYFYILLTTLAPVFETRYGFSTQSASLVYIGLGLGMIAGIFCCRFTLDRYVKLSQPAKPEQRLLPMIVAGIIVPIGLLWYGWSAELQVHWICPIFGLALCGFSVAATIIPSFSYVVDAFGIHAASAIAAIITLRCLTGVFLPLAGPALFDRLGLGLGTTTLALIAIAFIPVPVIILRLGERMRNNSSLKIVV